MLTRRTPASSSAARRFGRRGAAGAALISLAVGSLAAAVVPSAAFADAAEAEISDLVLGVGATEAERNLAWYSDVDVEQVAQIAKAADVTGDEFPASAETVEASASGETTSGEYFRDASFDGLEENTEYVYRVGSDEAGWSETQSFRTQAFSGDFSFLFFGDPQVGASGNLANDEAGWIDTMNVATESHPNSELLFSAGDQVNTASSEDEYTSFLAPEQMRSIPLVATNGNHDVGSKAYEQHYNLPNEDLTAGAAGNDSSSGGDYWFIYKDVLFVNINSNSRDHDSHAEFMRKVVEEHGDAAKWKVVAFHHSIYSVASHATDGDIIERRDALPSTISELGFDVALMGHDHHYTRSYLIQDGELADAAEVAGQEKVEAKNGEVLYLTANSASGSKYYDLNGAQNDEDHWWSSVRNQEKVRNYSVLDVTDDSITMTTLRSEANGDEAPVNSVVDEVELTRDAAPELTVPADGEIEAGSDFDPLEGVSAEDNVDGDLTGDVEVDGTVDTATAGEYTLTYSVTDARGNTTTQERVVTVVEAGDDDGGSGDDGSGDGGAGSSDGGSGDDESSDGGSGDGAGEPGDDAPATGEPSFTPDAPAADGADLPESERDGITASVSGDTLSLGGLNAGAWNYVYLYSSPTGLGWVEADADGEASLTLPDDVADGTHRVAVLDDAGDLIGWAEITIGEDGELAVTGADLAGAWGLGALAVLLLAGGGTLLVTRRRRAIRH